MDEIEERLMSLSDDEKIDRLGHESNYYYVKILVMSLQSDELKLQMIDKLQDYDKANLVESLQSDDLKLDYIKNMKQDDYKKADIAKSIKSDELKIQALSVFEDNDDFNKCAIIITLQSDEKKIEAMKQHIRPYNYREVIESLSSSENKIANLNLLNSSYDKQKVLESIEIENDEQRLSIATSVKDDYIASKFIKEIEDEEKKIQAIELLSSEGYKKDIILTLDEKNRISFLEQIKNSTMQDEIIASITDESVKVEHLQDISDENLKCKVLTSLESDEQKLTQLYQLKLENEDNFAIVIASLKSDEAKLSQLGKMTDSKNITLIEMSLTDREKLKGTFLDENRMYSEIGLDEKMTIGMEIESEGAMSSQIQMLKKVLKEQDRNSKDDLFQAMLGVETRGWETKGDCSLEEGVEIVSPILTDNKEDVEDIYMVCSMLQKCGHDTNERCGGHIHIGSDYLKSKEAYVNLFEIWGNAEKIICKMSNEIGTIPRMGLQEYASPISPKLNEAIESETINLESEEDLEQFISEIQEVQESRYSGLNLLNINNGKNTIEFRISNGTTNPDTWIENARLYGRIVQISQKLAEIEKQPEHSKEDEKLLDLKGQLKEEIPEQEKMEILLELLFSEEERKVYRERYISSSELLEQIPDEKNPFQETEFSRVDFKKKKHSLDEFHDVAVNDRSETTNEATRETVQGVRTEGELEQVNNKNMEEK